MKKRAEPRSGEDLIRYVFLFLFFFRLTSLTVYLLGSPVEIHLAGGERQSVMLGRGGRSGGMLMARRQGRVVPLRARAAAAAAPAAR